MAVYWSKATSLTGSSLTFWGHTDVEIVWIETKVAALFCTTCYMLWKRERLRGERAKVRGPHWPACPRSECVEWQREMKSGGVLRSGPRCQGEQTFPVHLCLHSGPWPPHAPGQIGWRVWGVQCLLCVWCALGGCRVSQSGIKYGCLMAKDVK